MNNSLKSIQTEIEHLQAEYRAISSHNTGVIRGAEQTSEIIDRIQTLMREYNSRSKRTQYAGGKVVPCRT